MLFFSHPLKILSILFIPILFNQCQNADSTTPKTNSGNEFQQILTENTLDQWEGNPDYWRFENSVLIGEITPDKILIENTFFVWKDQIVNDFELKAEFRVSPRGNSGINYRSEEIEGKQYVMKGYQADFDSKNQYTGQLYDEKGRGFLSELGQVTYIDDSNKVHKVGAIGDESNLSAILNDKGTWNEYHLVVTGNTHILMINGHVTSIAIDNSKNQKKSGLIGLQLHLGPPMKVEFRNLRFKNITP